MIYSDVQGVVARERWSRLRLKPPIIDTARKIIAVARERWSRLRLKRKRFLIKDPPLSVWQGSGGLA